MWQEHGEWDLVALLVFEQIGVGGTHESEGVEALGNYQYSWWGRHGVDSLVADRVAASAAHHR